ncbi:hypothetical protein BC832DRAFT_457710 [Gaertneriomyces semiglobifer]|nr:hypothetical protein BC832DRAFT_457710 [Gaertneriomyces semiglobifer]
MSKFQEAEIPTNAATHESRSERSYKAAAHNEGNYIAGRLHAAEMYAKLHEERTGEKIDPKHEASLSQDPAMIDTDPKSQRELAEFIDNDEDL